jgi:serum/glucocorticoid-regulated kinase 2
VPPHSFQAEYIAPELLKGQKYGAAVDWWSFGVLMYEMMGFKTPFFDKNRKLMFFNIINNEPQWQPHFSPAATGVLKALLAKAPTKRLGSGAEGPAEIKRQPFFAPIDWDKLSAKQLEPPFKPEVSNILDPKFVPKTYLNEKAADSFDRNAKGSTNVDFDNFTYTPASALDP